MKRLAFDILIQAPREIVWEVMLTPETYKDWTAALTEGSYYEGSWNQGESIRFMAPGGSGVVSVIAENRLYEYISIKHLGMIKDGIVDTESESVRSWAPAYENYTFLQTGGATELKVETDTTEDSEAHLAAIWPRALDRLKALCESR